MSASAQVEIIEQGEKVRVIDSKGLELRVEREQPEKSKR